MSNVIKLLPDSVANQIAAGEVIQRPASAVKELLENSVDAGATEIHLVIKDAGKTLIQVTDNGSGMSAIDIRMCFERHATSKITKAEDLFSIHTLGFRGEAMASIAAIAQVEIKSRPEGDELGNCLRIEGSKVISQEPCSCPAGTTIMVKNLFFNVPARRNFLKSYNAETRHILEEFSRVALINPEIAFTLEHNGKTVYNLVKGSLKSRIVAIFGKVYDQRLLSVSQITDILNISGFILKPEFAKKTRGEQYFFVNQRYIKHGYLNHAVTNAFSELLPGDSFPSYFINIEIDPSDIDINIHPTKTEVNFKDAKYVYAVLQAAVKQSVGMHNLTPTIDFDVDPTIEAAFQNPAKGIVKQPEIKINPDYNPFESGKGISYRDSSSFKREKSVQNWEKLFTPTSQKEERQEVSSFESSKEITDQQDTPHSFFQVHRKYIVCNVRSGMMLIDQQKAHERILYEKFLKQLQGKEQASQQQLFPVEIYFSPEDISILEELMGFLKTLGFILEKELHQYVVKGIPADLNDENIQLSLERIIENYKTQNAELGIDKPIRLARAMAARFSVRSGESLTNEEMADLFDRLFACQVPEQALDGSKIIGIVTNEILEGFLR
ncbi:MAG: DNA mismatch repair endonuclease MutL [Bacteroidales bacterium]|nr:DNA mismatch repair endonuclease MutL [Bacteroidales bacterium]